MLSLIVSFNCALNILSLFQVVQILQGVQLSQGVQISLRRVQTPHYCALHPAMILTYDVSRLRGAAREGRCRSSHDLDRRGQLMRVRAFTSYIIGHQLVATMGTTSCCKNFVPPPWFSL